MPTIEKCDAKKIRITMGHSSFWLSVAFASATASAAIAQEPAQNPPDPLRGRQLAQSFCINCHLVDPDQSGGINEGIPSFRAIANRPGQTHENIVNFLVEPHPPMPDMQLTRSEIRDLTAYLDTLRRPEAGAPLLKTKPKQKTKPKLPKQS
ncbi:MAG: c-type cytochrome [Hyphomicrobiaceae bacterium]